ncbi:MAG: chromosomal replication initiator protein DnaA [Chthoniobacterales bacterium]|nr:chromosomal replication initiator protein DnaA [Chthoniobacterales bacterium]
MPRSISPRSKSRAPTNGAPTRQAPPGGRVGPSKAGSAQTVNNSASGEGLEALWSQISSALKAELGDGIFDRWFSTLRPSVLDAHQIVLPIPNSIYQVWIESNYAPQVQAALLSVLGGKRKLVFKVENGVVDEKTRTKEPVAMEEPVEAVEAPGLKGLNPHYLFETFVVGTNSEFAHAAALAVAKSPALTYNPLFIHGGVGLGKTHLLQAIGHHLAASRSGTKVAYVRSETFTNEFINAIQTNSLVKFRRRYRQADILLIDDIQFLAGKERSQEEFFHTFNSLFEGRKQIVLSSDQPPSEISQLEQRLVSRFEWGLTAELQPPDMETRLAILRKKAAGLDVKLPAHVLDYLAHRIKSNVRRLEGALLRVASFSSLSGRPLTDESIEHLLRDILQEEARRVVTVDQVQRKVAEHYDVRIADMTGKRRPAHIAFARQVAMFISRRQTKNSLQDIGEAFGGRDHGTVIHACKTVQARMEKEESLRQVIGFLESSLQRG